jgi:hypothetical protein
LAEIETRGLADLSSKLRGQPVQVVGEEGGFVAGAGDGDAAELRVEQVRMKTRVGVDEDAFGVSPWALWLVIA